MKTFIVDKSIIDSFDSNDFGQLEKLANIHRINCLAGLKSASHGWLGACFSGIDILSSIYHRFIPNPSIESTQRGALHMSKGHAAMAQYAILAALGCFELERLNTYKQLDGLPAHCDRSVPGVDSDSGSLGQGLSKAIGNALSNNIDSREIKPVFALMGDGEMQEGQLFEALLTLAKHNPRGVVPILDRNYLQSDSRTADIKDAADWVKVFEGIGLVVYEIDGHNFEEIVCAIEKVLSGNAPAIIIAHTIKGAGSSITSMSKDVARREGVWHGKIPSDGEYLQILEELVGKIDHKVLNQSFKEFKEQYTCDNHEEPDDKSDNKNLSTGEAFTAALAKYANDKNIFVLDADLEKSCKLTDVARLFNERYIEVGISEQDMTSIAAGIGLTGKIAVVNTYASFFKRSLDQIFAVATEKVPVIFAAHYSGADYFTDGKSHQAVNDIGLMRCIGDIEMVEPVDEKSTEALLAYAIERMRKEFSETGKCRPTYIRLHRTPCNTGISSPLADSGCRKFISALESVKRGVLFTSGPHMTKTALKSQRALEDIGIALDVVIVQRFTDENQVLKNLIAKYNNVFTLEDHRRETGLGAFIGALGFKNPVRIGARAYSQSALSLSDMLKFHQIRVVDVCAVVNKVFACKDHK